MPWDSIVTFRWQCATLARAAFVAGLGCSCLAGQSAAPIQFTDVTAAAGIKFTHFKGNQGISINREEFGPGVCVAEFDSDGWQDIYFVNGRDLYDRGITVRNALSQPGRRNFCRRDR